MDVMEEMTAIDIGKISAIDRSSVAGSLDRLAEYLAASPCIRCHEKRSFWLRRRSVRNQMRFT
jgi:hypothetical protein